MEANKENRILNILEDEVFTVHNYKEHYLNTNNGVLNDEHLQREKKHLLCESVSYLVDEVVGYTQHYPHDDISKVELETDFVVMKRGAFEELRDFATETANHNKKIREAVQKFLDKHRKFPTSTMEATEISNDIIGEDE